MIMTFLAFKVNGTKRGFIKINYSQRSMEVKFPHHAFEAFLVNSLQVQVAVPGGKVVSRVPAHYTTAPEHYSIVPAHYTTLPEH